MNSDKINLDFESALSAAIPAIAQVTQQYQLSGAFKTKLEILLDKHTAGMGCTVDRNTGKTVCITSRESSTSALEFSPETLTPELDPEYAKQFWTEIASILSSTIDLLESSIQNTGENFEVHFCIETATLNSEQPVVCQWDGDTSQVNILQCSKP